MSGRLLPASEGNRAGAFLCASVFFGDITRCSVSAHPWAFFYVLNQTFLLLLRFIHLLVNHFPTSLSQLSIRIGISICQKGFLHTKSANRSYMPFIMISVFGIDGSVNSRNFVPVRVWKTVRRKKLLSMDSIPEGARLGSGYCHV